MLQNRTENVVLTVLDVFGIGHFVIRICFEFRNSSFGFTLWFFRHPLKERKLG